MPHGGRTGCGELHAALARARPPALHVARCRWLPPHAVPAPHSALPRCGPCQMMGQILDEVAPTMRNRVKFVKVSARCAAARAGLGWAGCRGCHVGPTHFAFCCHVCAAGRHGEVPNRCQPVQHWRCVGGRPRPCWQPLAAAPVHRAAALTLRRPAPLQPARFPSPCPAPAAALPTLVLFKQGQPVDRIEGVVMAPDLRARLEYLLAQR